MLNNAKIYPCLEDYSEELLLPVLQAQVDVHWCEQVRERIGRCIAVLSGSSLVAVSDPIADAEEEDAIESDLRGSVFDDNADAVDSVDGEHQGDGSGEGTCEDLHNQSDDDDNDEQVDVTVWAGALDFHSSDSEDDVIVGMGSDRRETAL